MSLLLAIAVTLDARAANDPFDVDVDIPYTLFKLDNGLTVIVHEDHKAPIVAVNVWYHVGRRTRFGARPALPTCSNT
ncbi:MAG: hypothetical protein U5O39_14270 [Gammaproteobacteria bacterium]|nr:hypothetical protein [Gammaproteobacteria bacterium]